MQSGWVGFFNVAVRDGPYYICNVCNTLLYRKGVIELKTEKYSSKLRLFTNVLSFDGNMYICHTCHRSIKKKLLVRQWIIILQLMFHMN